MPALVTAFLLNVSACSDSPSHSENSNVGSGYGARPYLPEPHTSLIPTVHIAPARGWSADEKPKVAAGFGVNVYAMNLDHPRWLYVLPNGDVLVAETNAPPKPDDAKGIKGVVMKYMQKRAGAGVESANRITLLRDTDGDGIADLYTVFLEDLHSPFGMVLVGSDFYVAESDALRRFHYRKGETQIRAQDIATSVKVTDLPAGPINHHWTKNVVASADGSRLYVSIGSNSNVAENGIDKEEGRAAIWEINLGTGDKRSFASGLRNPVGMDWQPQSHALWVAVNERDELGNNLVPDYMTSVKEGGFYGWPYSYYGQHVDARVKPTNSTMVSTAIAPDYALGAHTGSLGLAFYSGTLLASHYRGGAFVGQHGSWNRNPRSGYKLIFVPFEYGLPSGKAEDIMTGFVNDEGDALGRPVGVAIDRTGAVLVADDVGNRIWRIVPAVVKENP